MENRMPNEFLSIDYQIRRDFHGAKFVSEIKGDMMILEENDGERSKIGHLSAYLIDFGRAFRTRDIDLLADVFEHSPILSKFYSYLLDPETNRLKKGLSNKYGREIPGKILIIESIKIAPDFRGKKWGVHFVQKTIDTFVQWRTDCVALQADFPMIKSGGGNAKEIAASRQRLERYWWMIGLEQINSDSVFLLWHEINEELREELGI